MNMKKTLILLASAGLSALLAVAIAFATGRTSAESSPGAAGISTALQYPEQRVIRNDEFDVQVLVDGRPLEEYAARGRTYVQAIEGSEYELRIRNPFPFRVAVALSVDGLNSIDARHTSAWAARPQTWESSQRSFSASGARFPCR